MAGSGFEKWSNRGVAASAPSLEETAANPERLNLLLASSCAKRAHGTVKRYVFKHKENPLTSE